jgi:hypothetical protein
VQCDILAGPGDYVIIFCINLHVVRMSNAGVYKDTSISFL